MDQDHIQANQLINPVKSHRNFKYSTKQEKKNLHLRKFGASQHLPFLGMSTTESDPIYLLAEEGKI